MKRYKAVIFDMDGTILDTIEDLADSVNVAMERFGFPTHTLEEVKSYVGNGLHKLTERAAPQASPEMTEEMFLFLMSYYRSHCNVKTKPYEGIPELLKTLRQQGIKTAVVSNKPDEAVRILADQMFDGCFDTALGAAEGVKIKPERAMMDLVLHRLGVGPGEAVYVGDSEVDIKTAENAEMPCICVTWGFRSREALMEAGAKIFADTPEDVLGLVLNKRIVAKEA